MPPQSHSDKYNYISAEIEKCKDWSLKGQNWWSFATHGSTVIIIIFSSTAAVLAQTDLGLAFLKPSQNLATILSLIVTIISAVQAKLGFEKKWIANRLTQNKIYLLNIDRNMGTDELADELATELKTILREHDQAITTG
jgi:hypothetical protein